MLSHSCELRWRPWRGALSGVVSLSVDEVAGRQHVNEFRVRALVRDHTCVEKPLLDHLKEHLDPVAFGFGAARGRVELDMNLRSERDDCEVVVRRMQEQLHLCNSPVMGAVRDELRRVRVVSA